MHRMRSTFFYVLSVVFLLCLIFLLIQFVQLGVSSSYERAVLIKRKQHVKTESVSNPIVVQKPIIEKPIVTAVEPTIYMIQKGDTLTKLSRQFSYSVDELANFNQIRNVNLIYANSVLRIPQKASH